MRINLKLFIYFFQSNRVLGIAIDYGYLNTVISVKQVKIARDKYLIKFMNRFIQMTTIWIAFAIFVNYFSFKISLLIQSYHIPSSYNPIKIQFYLMPFFILNQLCCQNLFQISFNWILLKYYLKSVIFWKNIRQTTRTIINVSEKDQYLLILESVIIYSQGVPVLLYAIFHASYYIIKYQLEIKHSQKDQDLKINNSGAITNLSHVDIAVFSLNGAFIKNESNDSVQGVYLNNKFYSIYNDIYPHTNHNRQSMKILSEDDYQSSPSPLNKMLQGLSHPALSQNERALDKLIQFRQKNKLHLFSKK